MWGIQLGMIDHGIDDEAMAGRDEEDTGISQC